MSKRSICRVWAYISSLANEGRKQKKQLAEQKMQADWLESSSVKQSSFCHLLFENDGMRHNVFEITVIPFQDFAGSGENSKLSCYSATCQDSSTKELSIQGCMIETSYFNLFSQLGIRKADPTYGEAQG